MKYPEFSKGTLGLSGRRIAIHIGSHRTGNVSFHDYLAQHCGDPATSPIDALYPPLSRRKNAYVGITKLAENIRQHINLWAADPILHARPCLISDENCMGSIAENLIQVTAYKSLGRRLNELKYAIPPDVEICLTIRDYTGWWESQILYGLRYKAGSALTEDQILELVRPTRGWGEIVEDINEHFPNARLRIWDFKTFAGKQKDQLESFSNLVEGSSLPVDSFWRNRVRVDMPSHVLDKVRQISPERASVFRESGHIFYEDEILEMRQSYEEALGALHPYMEL